MRRLVDLSLRTLSRFTLGVFFRQVELLGANQLPSAGPTIYVGNHYNALIDPALALGWLPLGVRMLAKSTLWTQVPVGLFVRLAGAVPVYRHTDAGTDTSKNVEMFTRCWEILGAGGSIALFPEGLSHNEPRLQPLKTGAARIALGALGRHPEVALSIVPVGLIFEERERFRSRALIEIGRPIDPRRALTAAAENDQAAVRALTETIERQLEAVTLNYSSWQEADLVRRAATLYASELTGKAAGATLSSGLPYQRAFAEGYGDIKRQLPEETAQVRRQTEVYGRMLDLTGLTDRQVMADYPPILVARFLLRSTIELLILLPSGLLGTLLNWLPYKIPRWAVRFLPIGPDQHASYKLMISIFVFPAVWLLATAFVWRRWGYTLALPLLLVAPLSGYAALLLKERLERLLVESRAYLVQRGRGSLSTRLRERRADLLSSIRRLVDHYVAETDAPGPSQS